jgi:dUTP pyrophosphatase
MVKFIKQSPKAQKPVRAYVGDAGFDLFISRTQVIPPRSFADVHTDISAAIPEGLWARIVGRSSTIRKYGLQVQDAVIDQGYRGELFIGVWNMTDNQVVVNEGSRIAQLIFHLIVAPEWQEVKRLPKSDRGRKGFGSSGK